MAQGTLVERQINDGLWLIQELHRDGFDVTAAFWLGESEDSPWALYIASKEVGEKGITAAYRVIHEAFNRRPDLWISRFDVKLISPSDPLTQDVLRVRRPESMIPTRYHGSRLGKLSIEEAYIYGPLPEGAAANP
jgi:hypothetical protein